MFTIIISGVPIVIYNRYSLAETICSPFKTDQKPLIAINVTSEEILREEGETLAHAELLCINRKIALALLNYDAFLLHAAVVDIDGHGLAFSAPSGIGKTTRVLQWKDTFGERLKVINGDKPIIRFVDDQLLAFGTPWMGKEGLGCNSSVPLEYICFLERSENVSVTLLNHKQIRQVFFPKDKSQVEYFMDLMDRFTRQVSFYLLKCNLEKENPAKIWDEITLIRTSETENNRGNRLKLNVKAQ